MVIRMAMNNARKQSLLRIGLFLGIVVFANILGNAIYTHFDLTEEKRFTLTKPTVKMLDKLDDVVYVRILLEGKFPAGFKRLQRATREMLNDFRNHSSFIEYEFEDPNEGSIDLVNRRREEMAKEGITPTVFRLKDVEGTSEKLIYPYAIFYYRGRNVAVNLLENQRGLNQEVVLNNSVSLLEYKFANAIQKLQQPSKPVLAFTTGRGELTELQTRDLLGTLQPYYEVGRFNLDSAYQIPPQIELLMVAKPRAGFTERDKFLIDQYVMNGGKVLWMLDRLNAELDSMANQRNFIPLEYPLNLDDLLFRYGVRIEPNLVLDLQCSKIPQVIGMQGGNPQIDLFDWYYHPVVIPQSQHPIVKGLDNVNLFFPSRIDTVKTKTDIEKTVLLASSQYSREQYSPVRLNFEILRYDPDPSKFNRPNLPFAVLLEGEFPSLYENRVTESMLEGLRQLGAEYKSQSVPTRMIVISDGDIAANVINNRETGAVMPLGYNRYERRQYGNKDFLLNCIEYLLDDGGVIEARGKEVKLRLLDTVRASEQKGMWQLLNLGLPLLLLAAFGFGFNYWRRRRYASVKNT
jgi:ABC-2 type transport system permease protein